MHRVRLAVRENPLNTSVIGEKHYAPAIEETGRGWVIEVGNQIVAFAIGNAQTGNIWALFVDPEFEGQGFGRSLQEVMVAWLFGRGLRRLHLGTAPGTRAQRFYEAAGWKHMGTHQNGEIMYALINPSNT